MKFLNNFDKKTQAEDKKLAKKFIEEIKSNAIPKRTLPNEAEVFPVDEAYESFVNISSSSETIDLMKSAYDERKK